MNKSYEGVTLNWTYEHLSMRVYKHVSMRAYKHVIIAQTSIWVFKHPSTQTSNFLMSSSFKHNRLSIWAWVHPTTHSLMPPSQYTFHEPHVCTCVWISNMWISMHVSMKSLKHFNIGVGNHQRVQAFEIEGIQASGYAIIKACRHGSILSSRHVNIEACEHRSM